MSIVLQCIVHFPCVRVYEIFGWGSAHIYVPYVLVGLG